MCGVVTAFAFGELLGVSWGDRRVTEEVEEKTLYWLEVEVCSLFQDDRAMFVLMNVYASANIFGRAREANGRDRVKETMFVWSRRATEKRRECLCRPATCGDRNYILLRGAWYLFAKVDAV